MFYEQFLNNFSDSINEWVFLINIGVTTILALLIRIYYIHLGQSISNRTRFANNFLPLALTTMLIITIVKSSIALSLGLVGALSIVRFRAAIKDPEELTFLFLVIGVGLATGAEQPILAIISITIILLLLFVVRLFSNDAAYKADDKMYVNIQTDRQDIQDISNILIEHFSFVELKRLDTLEEGMDLSFLCKADSLEKINAAKAELLSLGPNTRLSLVDQPNLVV